MTGFTCMNSNVDPCVGLTGPAAEQCTDEQYCRERGGTWVGDDMVVTARVDDLDAGVGQCKYPHVDAQVVHDSPPDTGIVDAGVGDAPRD
jgi:hypothetical protein